ncbi:MAG: LysR family transcriptional regulator [Emcibacter sp.]|nr:LysR family transcriptional regulator [Emcibacter sp.]
MLDISDINRITVLAAEGSFNKAAPKLSMSQPALTKRIARLEDILGMILFHRSTKGVIPTDFGKKIITDGTAISKQMTILERELVMMAGQEVGTLRLGVGPVIEEEILPKTLGDFLKNFPHVGFHIKVDNAANLMVMLEEGEIDIAVGAFSNVEKFWDYHVESLGQRNVIFVACPSHPLFSFEASKIDMAAVFKYPLAVPSIPPAIETWFEDEHDGPLDKEKYLLSENYRLLVAVAKSTHHVVAGPDILFSEDIKSGQLKVIPLYSFPLWEAYIVMRPEAIHTPLVKTLSQMIKATFSTF